MSQRYGFSVFFSVSSYPAHKVLKKPAKNPTLLGWEIYILRNTMSENTAQAKCCCAKMCCCHDT